MLKASGVTMSQENKMIFVEICKVGHARHGKEYNTARAIADYNEYMLETVSDCKKIGNTYYLADAVFESIEVVYSHGLARRIKRHGLTAEIQAEIEAERREKMTAENVELKTALQIKRASNIKP